MSVIENINKCIREQYVKYVEENNKYFHNFKLKRALFFKEVKIKSLLFRKSSLKINYFSPYLNFPSCHFNNVIMIKNMFPAASTWWYTHLRKHSHQNISVICNFCGKSFSKLSLGDHILKEHKNPKKFKVV